MSRRPATAALVAEAIGTFVLVLAGCGAVAVDARSHTLGPFGVAAAFGLAIMAMVYALGHISGAHFNPAVTVGFAVGRHFSPRQVGPYWFAQLGGALAAALTLRLSLGPHAALGVTHPTVDAAAAFVWEAILSGVLMLVITAVATDTRAVGQAAAIAIGGTIALAALVGGPISGGSLNPARSLGPALVAGDLDGIWVYLIAPPLGAVAGALAYGWLREWSTSAG